MTVKFNVLMNSDREALLKVVSDGSGNGTYKLSDLCYREGVDTGTKFQQPFADKPLSVSIRAVQWTGDDMGKLVLKRNNNIILTIVANPAGALKFDGEFAYAELSEATSDLVFEASGAGVQCWLLLRKNDYRSFIEEANMGAYDDPTKIDYGTNGAS